MAGILGSLHLHSWTYTTLTGSNVLGHFITAETKQSI